jgi:hypothetical protein
MRGPSFLTVLFLGVAGAVLWFGHDAWEKRQEAVRQCGKAHFDAWRPGFVGLVQQHDRIVDAASTAPRINLAPMILQMTEVEAKAAEAVPPPCAAKAQELTISAMSARSAAFKSFALKEGQERFDQLVSKARSDALEGARLLEEAEAKAR